MPSRRAATACPAVPQAPRGQRVPGPRQGWRPSARGRGGAGGGRRRGRPKRRPPDGMAGRGIPAVTDRPTAVQHPGHRARAGTNEDGGLRGPRALEGAPPRGRHVPGARRRDRDRDARPCLRLVPAAAQPRPRPRGLGPIRRRGPPPSGSAAAPPSRLLARRRTGSPICPGRRPDPGAPASLGLPPQSRFVEPADAQLDLPLHDRPRRARGADAASGCESSAPKLRSGSSTAKAQRRRGWTCAATASGRLPRRWT